MKEILNKVIKNIKVEYNYINEQPQPIIFDHIPKCAGTTINAFLYNYYPSRFIFRVGAVMDKVNKFKQFSDKKKSQYKFINGHFANLLVDEVGQNTIAIIVFREPIDRIVSHYYYVKRMKGHYLHERVFVRENISLKDYCSKIDNIELKNFYVRRYSLLGEEGIMKNPEKAVELAFNNIDQKYDIVGFQDKIPEFMDQLIEKANFSKGSYKNKMENKTFDRTHLEHIDKETIESIGRSNSLDIELYNRLRARFV